MILTDKFLSSIEQNFDAATAFYFQDEVTARIEGYIETAYADLNGAKLIPVKNSALPGQKFVEYLKYDTAGKPEYTVDLATDIPYVSARAEKASFPIFTKVLGMQYSSEDEIMGNLTNRSYIEQMIKAIIRGHAQDTNDLMFNGDYRTPGWVNNINIDKSIVANGASGSPNWESKTADEMVKDLNDAITNILDNTNNFHKVNTIALPLSQYRRLQTTRLGTGLQSTALEQFYYCNPGVTVEAANELESKFTGGVNGFIAYEKSPDNFWFEMGELYATELHKKGVMNYEMAYLKSHGGVQFIRPKSQIIKFGI